MSYECYFNSSETYSKDKNKVLILCIQALCFNSASIVKVSSNDDDISYSANLFLTAGGPPGKGTGSGYFQ